MNIPVERIPRLVNLDEIVEAAEHVALVYGGGGTDSSDLIRDAFNFFAHILSKDEL